MNTYEFYLPFTLGAMIKLINTSADDPEFTARQLEADFYARYAAENLGRDFTDYFTEIWNMALETA